MEFFRKHIDRPVAFVVAILLILGASALAYRSIAELIDSAALVEHTLEVQHEVDGLFSLLKDAETSQGGYLLAGDETFLESYRAALPLLPEALARVRRLTADNPGQHRRQVLLETLVADRLARLAILIEARRSGGAGAIDEAALLEGKAAMDRVRALVAEMIDEEGRLLRSRQEAVQTRARVAEYSLIGGTIIGLVLLSLILYLLSREVARRRAAEAEQRTLNAELDERIRERTAELEYSQRFMTAIVANMQDALFVTRAGKIVFANSACIVLFGASDANLIIGRSPLDFFHPDYHALIGERVDVILEQGRSVPAIEEKIVRLDGTVVDVEVAAAGFLDREDRVILVVVRDITARKLADEQLRASEARYREVVDLLLEAIWIHADGQIVFANGEAARMFGFSRPEELIGRRVLDLVHPDDRSRAEGRTRAVAAGGRVPIAEMRYVRTDGGIVTMEVQATASTFEGRPAVLAAGRDITLRKAAEERLRASETRYREVVDLLLEAIWIHADGQIVFANGEAARMFGFGRPEELIGRPVLDLVHPDDRDRAKQRTRTITEGRQPVPMTEMRFVGHDGRTLLLEVRATPFTVEGRPAALVVGRDITARKSAEDQLRQAQKMEAVGQLTGGLAHDFNNLLTVVIGNLDLLASRLKNDTMARPLAQDALSAALRGAELTRKLLAFSRRQPLQATAVDVNDLVRGMTELLRRSLGESIEITLNTVGDLWPIDTDPAQLESALVNLAVNARDAMPKGGRLTIETANQHLDERYAAQNASVTPGDYVMIAVTDTGTGIDPEHLVHVIEPFFTTKEVGKGSGLGLSMIYGFARQSGGHLKIYSEVGHGTTVRLYLPRGKAAPGLDTAEIPAAEDRSAGGELILVVDDNAHVRRTVMAQLTELGYRTLEAADAASALDLLKATPGVDLLFTDVVMPGGMGGVELGEAARRIRPEIRVLYTSGFTEVSVRNGRTNSITGQHLLSKPYRKHELARRLRETLSAR